MNDDQCHCSLFGWPIRCHHVRCGPLLFGGHHVVVLCVVVTFQWCCSGIVVVFIKYTTMTDERWPRSSFVIWLPHRPVAMWHQVLVLITKGGGQVVSIDYWPTMKTMNNKLFIILSLHCCQQHSTVSCMLICWGWQCGHVVRVYWNMLCPLWAVDGCSAQWFMLMHWDHGWY